MKYFLTNPFKTFDVFAVFNLPFKTKQNQKRQNDIENVSTNCVTKSNSQKSNNGHTFFFFLKIKEKNTFKVSACVPSGFLILAGINEVLRFRHFQHPQTNDSKASKPGGCLGNALPLNPPSHYPTFHPINPTPSRARPQP